MGPERIIERERRWAVPAAIAAFLAAILIIGSLVIEERADLQDSGPTTEQLRSIDEHAGTVFAASVVRAAGFLAMIPALLYLFRAAQARNPRRHPAGSERPMGVHPAMVGFVFIGPLLFAAQGVFAAVAESDYAADFVAAPQVEERSYEEFARQLERDPGSLEEVTIYTEDDSLDVEETGERFYAVSYEPGVEEGLPQRLEDADVSSEEDSDGGPGDAYAESLVEDSGLTQIAFSLGLPALVAFITAMVYVPLQAMRVGLLTRFFATLGMALGPSIFLLGLTALTAILLWLVYLGLIFLGLVPRGRPPAWDAGAAIPWPPPGEEAEEAEEPDEAEAFTEGSANAARRERAKRRKRKRRR